jgi:predicted Zn-dependent protease with MMP-like domain
MIDLSLEEFEGIVAEAVRTIPAGYLEKLDNVAIVVEDWPSPSHLRKVGLRRGNFLLGLYEGVPQTKRQYYQALPDKITIFKKPIEAMAYSHRDIEEIVKNTVWHEVAHHFGMDERGVREAERKRRARLKRARSLAF